MIDSKQLALFAGAFNTRERFPRQAANYLGSFRAALSLSTG